MNPTLVDVHNNLGDLWRAQVCVLHNLYQISYITGSRGFSSHGNNYCWLEAAEDLNQQPSHAVLAAQQRWQAVLTWTRLNVQHGSSSGCLPVKSLKSHTLWV